MNTIASPLCTVLSNGEGTTIGTVEHLMAALAGAEIDNAVVELDGPEIPIMDGSAAPFLFLIECAGLVEQDAVRRAIKVLKPVRVIEADARFYDYELLPQPLVVVANLPYSMGMAILQRLLTFRQRLSRLVIMLQKEVAARLLAQPNSSAYGALSVFFQYYTRMTHNFDVSRHAFTPMPAVDSSVITLRPFPVSPWPGESHARRPAALARSYRARAWQAGARPFVRPA